MLYIMKNNVFKPTFEFKECDGSPMDLSSCTVKFIVKRQIEDIDEDALLSSSYENPDTNILMFEFLPESTSNLPETSAVCAIKLFRESGKNEEVWSDVVEIKKGVFNE